MKFRELKIGQSFDFIAPDRPNSFFLRCTRISARKYKDERGEVHTVGTINTRVYHVTQERWTQ